MQKINANLSVGGCYLKFCEDRTYVTGATGDTAADMLNQTLDDMDDWSGQASNDNQKVETSA